MAPNDAYGADEHTEVFPSNKHVWGGGGGGVRGGEGTQASVFKVLRYVAVTDILLHSWHCEMTALLPCRGSLRCVLKLSLCFCPGQCLSSLITDPHPHTHPRAPPLTFQVHFLASLAYFTWLSCRSHLQTIPSNDTVRSYHQIIPSDHTIQSCHQTTPQMIPLTFSGQFLSRFIVTTPLGVSQSWLREGRPVSLGYEKVGLPVLVTNK